MNERTLGDNASSTMEFSSADRLDPRSRRAEVEGILRQWKSGTAPDALAVLERHPQWAADKSFVLDLAYEEYCLKAEQGVAPNIPDFARRFPAFEASINHLLEVHRLLSFADVPAPRVVQWPEPGASILGFTLLEELGRGGFARVFLAEEEELDRRQVVVKLSTLGVDEARIMARLPHPHIVPVHSIRTDHEQGITLLCMPYYGRHTLWDVWNLLKDHGLSDSTFRLRRLLQESAAESADPLPKNFPEYYEEFVVQVGISVAGALACAHAAGVYHGDIKPSNILLTAAGQPMLLDFNLAVKGGDAPSGGGTLSYMAPEQLAPLAQGQPAAPIGPQSDLFSLGAVLYELLSGREPFGPLPEAESRSELCARLLELRKRGPRPLREFLPSIDPELENWVLKCLAFSPQERPRSALELGEHLQQYLHFPQRAKRWLSKHRRLVQGVAAATLVAGAMFAVFLLNRPPYAIRQMLEAQEAFRQGNLQQTASSVQAALDADPKLTDALFLRARARQNAGDFAAACEDYQSAYRLIPDPILLAGKAYCLECQGYHPQATESFFNAIKGGYASAEVWNDLGYIYLQDGNLEEAGRCLNEAVRANPYLQAARHNRVQLQIRLAIKHGTPPTDGALDDVAEAIRLGSLSSDLYYDAAMIQMLVDAKSRTSRERAIQWLTKGAELGLPAEAWRDNPLFAEIESEVPHSVEMHVSRPTLSDRLLDPIPADHLSLKGVSSKRAKR